MLEMTRAPACLYCLVEKILLATFLRGEQWHYKNAKILETKQKIATNLFCKNFYRHMQTTWKVMFSACLFLHREGVPRCLVLSKLEGTPWIGCGYPHLVRI